MYEALRLFNLHLQSALLQFNCQYVDTSVNKLLKNPTAVMEEQKIVKLLDGY